MLRQSEHETAGNDVKLVHTFALYYSVIFSDYRLASLTRQEQQVEGTTSTRTNPKSPEMEDI